MALIVKTTGLEQYAPGGEARIKLLIIGGAGVGKTRYASFFPKPIYADCEAGLASVADRRVPYVPVNSSQDMLDLLTHLKQECRMAKGSRRYETVVIDTLDAYQRKLKNEWMERERKETFSGWEAWGFVGQKMGLLLTRLLNLDMNVIVNVHYKDKTIKDDESGKETHELMLQLQGEIADTAFNDFDLVGWMGTYWEAEGGERIQKRGLTFKPTPDKPFLKDRLHVTPTWLEVTFDNSDYSKLFSRVMERAEQLEPGATVDEIPTAASDIPVAAVVTPEQVASGPIAAAAAVPAQRDALLGQLDKPSLMKLCRDEGVTTLPDGTPIRGNTLKAELINALEHHRATPAPAAEPEPQPETPAAVSVEEAIERVTAELGGVVLTPPAASEAKPVRVPRQGSAPAVEQLPDGATVNKATGEITPAAKPSQACEDCGKDLAGERQQFVKVAWIKYRKHLCEACAQARKNS